MESLIGLALIVVIYLALRGVWRGATRPIEDDGASGAFVAGAASGVEVDPTLPRPGPDGVVREQIARRREDGAFIEGVIFANYFLPDEVRERLPGYRVPDDTDVDPTDLGMDYEYLEELAVMGDEAWLSGETLAHPDAVDDFEDDPYDAYDLYDGHGYEDW